MQRKKERTNKKNFVSYPIIIETPEFTNTEESVSGASDTF